MMERLIFTALEQQRDEALADPSIIEEYFRKTRRITEQSELDAIVTHFVNSPPDIFHGFPREDSKFPAWSIILAAENESTNFLGDEGDIIGELPPDMVDSSIPGGWLDPDNPDAGADELVKIETQRYMVLTYSKHVDVSIAYYQISKLFMTRARAFLKEAGELLGIKFSGGDIFPDPRYIPSHLHTRQMTIEVEVVERVVGPKPARAFKVFGLHFPTDENVATVDAQVTVFDPEPS